MPGTFFRRVVSPQRRRSCSGWALKPWGHSVLNLLNALPLENSSDPAVMDAARLVDRFYMTARYPNGWCLRG